MCCRLSYKARPVKDGGSRTSKPEINQMPVSHISLRSPLATLSLEAHPTEKDAPVRPVPGVL